MGVEAFNLLLEEMNCHKEGIQPQNYWIRNQHHHKRIICKNLEKKVSILDNERIGITKKKNYFKSQYYVSNLQIFLFKGESLNTTLKVSSVISSQSFLVIDNTLFLLGLKAHYVV
jgi:hypothetical protein